jgi:hypothetical protein
MGFRDSRIAKSIVKALFSVARRHSFLARILAFFRVFDISLIRFRPDSFDKLQLVWKIDKEQYLESFATEHGADGSMVKSVGDLGYSGSVRRLQM